MTTLADIAHAVCVHLGVTEEQLFQRTRGLKEAAEARQVFYWLGREVTGKSFPQIARCLGRDHSTVIHGWRRVDARLANDDRFYSEVMAIKGEFR